jgi:hypothetical protein
MLRTGWVFVLRKVRVLPPRSTAMVPAATWTVTTWRTWMRPRAIFCTAIMMIPVFAGPPLGGGRLVSFPAQVAVPGPLARPGLDQPVADQHPVDAHPRRHRDHAQAPELVRQPQRTPLRMLPPHLTHRRLNIGADLVRTRFRPPGTISQRAQAALLIPADPGMHALPGHPRPGGDLGHRHPGPHLQDSAIPLFDNGHLHQCQSRPPASSPPANDE